MSKSIRPAMPWRFFCFAIGFIPACIVNSGSLSTEFKDQNNYTHLYDLRPHEIEGNILLTIGI